MNPFSHLQNGKGNFVFWATLDCTQGSILEGLWEQYEVVGIESRSAAYKADPGELSLQPRR